MKICLSLESQNTITSSMMAPKRAASSSLSSSHSSSKQSHQSSIGFVNEIFEKLKGKNFEEKYIHMQRMLTVEKKFDPDSLVSKICLIKLSVEYDMPLGTTSKEKVSSIATDPDLQGELSRVLSNGVEKQGFLFLEALKENPNQDKFGERGPLGTLDDVTQMLTVDTIVKMVGSATKKMSTIERILLLLDLIILRIDASHKLTSMFSKAVSALTKDDYQKIVYERILVRILLLQLYHFESNPNECFIRRFFEKETSQALARLIVIGVGNALRDDIQAITLPDFLEYTGILMCRLMDIGQDSIFLKDDLARERESWLQNGNGTAAMFLSKLCIEPGKNNPMGEDRLAWSLLGIIIHLHSIYGVNGNTLGIHTPELFGLTVKLPHYGEKLAALGVDDAMMIRVLERIGGPPIMSAFARLLQMSHQFEFSLKIINEFIIDVNHFEDLTSQCRFMILKVYSLLGTKNFEESAKLCRNLLTKIPIDWIGTGKSTEYVDVLEMQNLFGIEKSDAFPLVIILLEYSLLEYLKLQDLQPNQVAAYVLAFSDGIRQKFAKNWNPDVNGMIRKIIGNENHEIVPLFFDYAWNGHFCKLLSSNESLNDEDRMKLASRSRHRLTPFHQAYLFHHFLINHSNVFDLIFNPNMKIKDEPLSEEATRQLNEIIASIEVKAESGGSTPAVQLMEDDESSRGEISTRRSKTPMFFDMAMNDELMEIDSSSSGTSNQDTKTANSKWLTAVNSNNENK